MAWLRRHRVGLLRVAFIPIVLLAVFARPRWPLQSWAAFAIEALGYLVVVAGLLFRLWSIMYIGERKSRELVVEGPYSLCRHPLYTGTFLLSIGAGLCFENPPMSLAAILLVIPIHAVTAGMEERKLAAKFGSAYTSYAEGLPRFIPHFGRLRNMEWVKVSTRSIRRIILETVGVLLLPVFEDLLELLHDCDVIPVLWHFF
ncbi:MAG: isoprenylcysteine carboxylmethyltransferase family protein [Phycisphaerales bacterium]|nr:isoprenylcysteine carboxylmethyltransferase family protein [Phycisphaerales bacterium]